MKTSSKSEIVLVLDGIRSLHNTGSIFRTADAFGVSKIFLAGITPSPVDRLGKPVNGLAKTALGAERSVPWERAKHSWRLIDELQKSGYFIVALENNVRGTIPLPVFSTDYPLALVLGNEVRGVSEGVLKRAHAVVSIPMAGSKESLNVSVACGAALYALRFGVIQAGQR